MSEWIEKFAYDDDDVESIIDLKGEYEIQFYNCDEWEQVDGFDESGHMYRYRKIEKKPDYYGYEDFKDKWLIQITNKDQTFISVVTLIDKEYLFYGTGYGTGYRTYKSLSEDGYEWREQKINVDNYDDSTGLWFKNPRLEWSEWKSFRK